MDKKKLEYFKNEIGIPAVGVAPHGGSVLSRTDFSWMRVQLRTSPTALRATYAEDCYFHQSNDDRQLLQMVDGALFRSREGELGRVRLLWQGD